MSRNATATCMVEGTRMARTRPRETEASFMRAVCELAALTGWRQALLRVSLASNHANSVKGFSPRDPAGQDCIGMPMPAS